MPSVQSLISRTLFLNERPRVLYQGIFKGQGSIEVNFDSRGRAYRCETALKYARKKGCYVIEHFQGETGPWHIAHECILSFDLLEKEG
jgi:hypothetical protein